MAVLAVSIPNAYIWLVNCGVKTNPDTFYDTGDKSVKSNQPLTGTGHFLTTFSNSLYDF
jgi:hypothetical protein